MTGEPGHKKREPSAMVVPYSSQGSALASWLMPRTPDPEVGGSSPTRVKPCCVLEQGTFTPQKYWLYPGSGGSAPT